MCNCLPFLVVSKCSIYFPPSFPRKVAKSLREYMFCFLSKLDVHRLKGDVCGSILATLELLDRQTTMSSVCVHCCPIPAEGLGPQPPCLALSPRQVPSPELSRTIQTSSTGFSKLRMPSKYSGCFVPFLSTIS